MVSKATYTYNQSNFIMNISFRQLAKSDRDQVYFVL